MRTIKFLALCGIVLFVCSCSTCKIDKPKNLKAIDWNNYNDVYTVYWNNVKDCSEIGYDTTKYIKVYGWIRNNYNGFSFELVSSKEDIDSQDGRIIRIDILANVGDYEYQKILVDSLKAKFDSTDLSKKCYIRGELSYNELADNKCCSTVPRIYITNIDDIYFEEE